MSWDKSFFDPTTDKWHWYGAKASEALSKLTNLQLDPDNLVKLSPVRAVFKYQDIFLKFEMPSSNLKRLRNFFHSKSRNE